MIRQFAVIALLGSPVLFAHHPCPPQLALNGGGGGGKGKNISTQSSGKPVQDVMTNHDSPIVVNTGSLHFDLTTDGCHDGDVIVRAAVDTPLKVRVSSPTRFRDKVVSQEYTLAFSDRIQIWISHKSTPLGQAGGFLPVSATPDVVMRRVPYSGVEGPATWRIEPALSKYSAPKAAGASNVVGKFDVQEASNLPFRIVSVQVGSAPAISVASGSCMQLQIFDHNASADKRPAAPVKLSCMIGSATTGAGGTAIDPKTLKQQ